jgi:hypothetical protein
MRRSINWKYQISWESIFVGLRTWNYQSIKEIYEKFLQKTARGVFKSKGSIKHLELIEIVIVI